MLLLVRGSVWGAVIAFLAATLFLIGYFQSDAYGRRGFGVVMFAAALAGALSMALGADGLGELLLVISGIVAGARSITAFLKKVEDRNPPLADETPTDSDGSTPPDPTPKIDTTTPAAA
jgi:hypothetical protein